MTRRFTGWHMLAILVSGFGIVVAVNITLAVYASRSFTGTVVDNSYVASQRYNGWLAEARRQEALGWSETLARDGGRLAISIDSPVGPLDGAEIAAVASHPLDDTPPVALRFEAAGPGRYRSLETLPEGRWRLHLTIRRGGERKQIMRDLS